MSMKFFRLNDQVSYKGRWQLNNLRDANGVELDGRDFTYGRRVGDGSRIRIHRWNSEELIDVVLPLRLSLHTTGIPLDFTFTTSSVPVVTENVATILATIAGADIQRIPVVIESREREKYEIINIVSIIPCIERAASVLDWRTEADGRPDLVGRAKTILKLVVDPTAIGNSNLFLLGERPVDIIASSALKDAFARAEISGVIFEPV